MYFITLGFTCIPQSCIADYKLHHPVMVTMLMQWGLQQPGNRYILCPLQYARYLRMYYCFSCTYWVVTLRRRYNFSMKRVIYMCYYKLKWCSKKECGAPWQNGPYKRKHTEQHKTRWTPRRRHSGKNYFLLFFFSVFCYTLL